MHGARSCGSGNWQSAQHTGVTICNEPGALVWNEVAAQDQKAARAFYGAVFGFRFDEIDGVVGYAGGHPSRSCRRSTAYPSRRPSVRLGP